MSAPTGSRVVTTKACRVELVEPWKAGEDDPSMQDWLRLPVGYGEYASRCPRCDGTHFGTKNPRGYFHVRQCHNEPCGTLFRGQPSLQMLSEIADALNGRPKRFGIGNANEEGEG